MSGTTITAEATGAELLAELRELVNRYDGAASLDDVREFLDALTKPVRRARGRINRLVKASTPPAPVVKPKPAAEPAPKAEKPPAAVVKESMKPAGPKPVITTASPEVIPARPRLAPRRRVTSFHVALAVLTVVATVWSTTTTGTARRTRATVRAAQTAGRRAGRLAAAIRRGLARIGGAS